MKIAVTGATGFLGGWVARQAQAEGHEVVALGRNAAAGAALERKGVRFRQVDLGDPRGLCAAFQGTQAVVHAAALASPWGPTEAFQATNVRGTAHVLEAADLANVPRLVFVSSASVYAAFRDQSDLKENSALPPPINAYAASKQAAEKLVRARRPDAVILRPRALFGPGDPVLWPRLWRVARRGRFPLFRSGRARIDVSYVHDVAAACLASLYGRAGTYNITQGEPIGVKDLLETIFQLRQCPVRWVHLPLAPTLAAARFVEAWCGRHEEPAMTAYGVGALAGLHANACHWRGRARPGVAASVEFAQCPGANVRRPGAAMNVRTFHVPVSAHIRARLSRLEDGGKGWVDVPVRYGLVEHATEGPILVDTGYTAHLAHAPGACLAAYRRMLRPRLAAPLEPVAFLARRGWSPADVRHIVLTHLHADHACGLADFPEATIHLADDAAHAWHDTSWSATVHGRFPALWPRQARLSPLGTPWPDPRLPPGARGWDLLGDGSVWAVDLDGHAPGHLGVAFAVGGRRVLYAADVAWTRAGYRKNRRPPPPLRWAVARPTEANRACRTVLAAETDGWEVVLCHDPEPTSYDVCQ